MSGQVRADDLLGFVVPVVEAKNSVCFGRRNVERQGDQRFESGGWITIAQTLTVPVDASYVDVGVISEGFGSVEVRDLKIANSAAQR